jgi:cbb3-type cytochrome oxidase subunit 3
LNANVISCGCFLNLTLCMTKLRVLVLCLSYFTDNSIAWILLWGLLINVQYPMYSSQNKSLYVVEERSTFVLQCPKFKKQKKTLLMAISKSRGIVILFYLQWAVINLFLFFLGCVKVWWTSHIKWRSAV